MLKKGLVTEYIIVDCLMRGSSLAHTPLFTALLVSLSNELAARLFGLEYIQHVNAFPLHAWPFT